VAVQHREINNADTGGHFTVNVYYSEKVATDDAEWGHQHMSLKSDATADR
jgi:uncharacterized protein